MVPKSVLNDLRRQAVQRLLELRESRDQFAIAEPDVLENIRREITNGSLKPMQGQGLPCPTPAQCGADPGTDSARLHVMARTMDQLRAVLALALAETGLSPATVYCDFEDIRKYKDAVPLARAAGVPIGLATVRIIKPGEEGLLRQLADCRPDCVLVRNLAGLSWFSAQRRPTCRWSAITR